MLRLPYRNGEIQVDIAPPYTFGSIDNPHLYDHEYRLGDETYSPASLHSVRVLEEDEMVLASSILGAAGGASGIHGNSAIVHGNSLLIAVGPFVVSLELPALTLNWSVQTDWAVCFGVYHSTDNQCYISHGELEVAAVSYNGSILWSNSGADILTNGFFVSHNRITAFDWNDDKYVWDIATGRLLESTLDKTPNPSDELGDS